LVLKQVSQLVDGNFQVGRSDTELKQRKLIAKNLEVCIRRDKVANHLSYSSSDCSTSCGWTNDRNEKKR